MNHDKFLSKNKDILNQDINLKDLVEEVEKQVEKKGYYVAKNLMTMSSYEQCRSEAVKYMNHRLEVNKDYPYSLRGNVSAGMHDTFGFSKNKSWYIYRHCSFTWNTKESELQHLLHTSNCISKIRNLVNQKELDYGEAIEKDGYTAYTSLSLYPNNGGFLKQHVDGLEYASDGSKLRKILHFKIELTHKDVDYDKGGFYIRNKETGEMIDASKLLSPSDVLFFDGTQSHEVKPVHGGELGRIAFFQIPTYCTSESRISLYSGDGLSRLRSKIISFSNKLLLVLKKVAKKTIATVP